MNKKTINNTEVQNSFFFNLVEGVKIEKYG